MWNSTDRSSEAHDSVHATANWASGFLNTIQLIQELTEEGCCNLCKEGQILTQPNQKLQLMCRKASFFMLVSSDATVEEFVCSISAK